MKAEDQVPSRETCERLKEKGFPQAAHDYSGDHTYFAWYEKHAQGSEGEFELWATASEDFHDSYLCAAPTLAELLEVLRSPKGDHYEIDGFPGGWSIRDALAPFGTRVGGGDTLAEAAALLWLKVKGEK